MQSTWQCSAICCIVSAIFSAIVPETPVSISSKIIVGSALFFAVNAFRDSINRAISPPDAIAATSCIGLFLFALNNSEMVSPPFFSKDDLGVSEKSSFTCGIPNVCSCLMSDAAIVFAAAVRLFVNAFPIFTNVSNCRSASFAFSLIVSSIFSISLSRVFRC